MADTVKGSVILSSISVKSPGVGSMWEFKFKVDGKGQPPFTRVIRDGATADFRKTLFAMDIPAKQARQVKLEVDVREVDMVQSDDGSGSGSIAIDTSSGSQKRTSFQAQVTEKGGTRAGSVATLTFDLVSEVRGGTACQDCRKELDPAAKILDEFESVVGENLAITNGGTLADEFLTAFTNYDSARIAAEIEQHKWDDLAKQLRSCASQNPTKVKQTCLNAVDRIEELDDDVKQIALEFVPLLNTRADKMSRRYEAFIAEERIDIEIARCEAELKAKCVDNLDRTRQQLEAAKQAKKDRRDDVKSIAAAEIQADQMSKKLLTRLKKAIVGRTKPSVELQNCGAASNFGPCSPKAQPLIGQDALVAVTHDRLQAAYLAVDTLLENFNSRLSAIDDRLELLVENYTDALAQYTDCVSRLR